MEQSTTTILRANCTKIGSYDTRYTLFRFFFAAAAAAAEVFERMKVTNLFFSKVLNCWYQEYQKFTPDVKNDGNDHKECHRHDLNEKTIMILKINKKD